MLAGARNAWTGVGPTLARDVPYSAVYWYAVEQFRSVLGGDVAGHRRERTTRELAGINFVSGCVAGAVVAAATTPLDVVKTRMMLGNTTKSGELYVGTVNSLQTIFRCATTVTDRLIADRSLAYE